MCVRRTRPGERTSGPAAMKFQETESTEASKSHPKGQPSFASIDSAQGAILGRWHASPEGKGDDKKDQEYDEENLGDPHRRSFQTPKAEKPGDQGDDEKQECPPQHRLIPPVGKVLRSLLGLKLIAGSKVRNCRAKGQGRAAFQAGRRG